VKFGGIYRCDRFQDNDDDDSGPGPRSQFMFAGIDSERDDQCHRAAVAQHSLGRSGGGSVT
jgi:hypothetical protein